MTKIFIFKYFLFFGFFPLPLCFRHPLCISPSFLLSPLSPSLSIYLCAPTCHGALILSFPALSHLWSQVAFQPFHFSQFTPPRNSANPPEPPYLYWTLLLPLAVCLGRTVMWNRNKNTRNKNAWEFVLSADLLICPEISGFHSNIEVKMWRAFVRLMLLDYHRNSTQGDFHFYF